LTECTSYIWRDFGSALLFQTRLTQRKLVLPLSYEHGSQVKDQDRRQCCHNRYKKFPYQPTRDVSLLLLSGHASYIWSVVSDVYFQVEVSSMGRYLFQRSLTECVCVCVTECDQLQQYPSTPTMNRHRGHNKNKYLVIRISP